MLAIGRALMANPKLLMIDELSLGLMPMMIDLCYEALATLAQGWLTIILVEQNTARALDFADQVCVMTSGSLAFSGSAAQAKANDRLFDVFVSAH